MNSTKAIFSSSLYEWSAFSWAPPRVTTTNKYEATSNKCGRLHTVLRRDVQILSHRCGALWLTAGNCIKLFKIVLIIYYIIISLLFH
jgi:hypothetical protein